MSRDITYCDNTDCMFKYCERHYSNLESRDGKEVVSVASFAGVCKRYIAYLMDLAEN